MLKSGVDDTYLWQRIQAGDRSSFEILYHKYIRMLYLEVNKRIADKEIAEDLLQDVFLSLWEKRNQYTPKGDVYPYIRGMAINRILNHYRSNKAKPQYVKIWEELPESVADLQDLSEAFKQAENEAFESLLKQALEALPTRMRMVFELRFEQRKSVDEIANQLSTSPNTIRNQLKSIRKRFVHTLKGSSFITFF
ncbi:RNA polymerase sigma factor [Sphingobacterium haloxyli]|uniref:RNA polymerase subunit sigma-70 n=1 Tax=Sphingobacterium haloxyli TaxID=2100533 RepID=A0A2S9J2D1_9SPHI|nr:sigma-70 family RNA polymerase sigma factor [Sphingobacterium haloxyli]PRD46941.1 hypothetical protein C5745_12645 [Sphingobacterium haloxyli]